MPLTPEERAAGRTFRKAKARERKAAKDARPKSPKADRGRVRDPGFLAFLRRQPCAVGPQGCDGPVEAAHVRLATPERGSTGMQVKPSDRYAVPLCAAHHRTGNGAQHVIGERRFWDAHGKDPFKIAADLFARYGAS